jgi:formate C-acetyltransferase
MDGFRTGLWLKEINVRDFIQQNYEPYEGDESFLASVTERTKKISQREREWPYFRPKVQLSPELVP